MKEWIFLAVVMLLLLGSCGRGAFVNKSVAVRAAEAHGYSNIQVVDYAWFAVGFRGCSKDDAARFTVEATNSAGKQAKIYVCSGFLFKNATIRTD